MKTMLGGFAAPCNRASAAPPNRARLVTVVCICVAIRLLNLVGNLYVDRLRRETCPIAAGLIAQLAHRHPRTRLRIWRDLEVRNQVELARIYRKRLLGEF